jgi:hypothetical protein
VLLLTTGTFRDAQREVNEVIWAVRDSYDHVTVLDWSRILETGGLLSDDGVHLNRNGRRVIASAIARAVQFAPTDQPGACLDSRFRNDSKVADAMPTDDEVVADEPVETTVAPDVPATETTVP